VGGWDLPAGATVGPSILIAHGRSENHPDPERFDPDRFRGQHPPVNTWIPFGGGVRRCIGAGFSLMEGVAVLRQILATYDVTALGAGASEGPQHHQRAASRLPGPGGIARPPG
jgi:cytochrome P450